MLSILPTSKIHFAFSAVSQAPRPHSSPNPNSSSDSHFNSDLRSGSSDRNSNSSNKIWVSVVIGAISGAVGRLGTNNLTEMTMRFQAGNFKPDFSASTARGMLLGAKMQVATTFGIKAALGCKDEDPLDFKKATKYFLAGAAGRLAIQPSAVAFFLSPSSKPKKAIFPEIQDVKSVYQKCPRIFLRGLPMGMLCSGLDWTSYFFLRESLGEFQGAVLSTFLTTPLYQKYIMSIRDQNRVPTASNLTKGFSSHQKRLVITNILLNFVATLERYMVGKTETYLNKLT